MSSSSESEFEDLPYLVFHGAQIGRLARLSGRGGQFVELWDGRVAWLFGDEARRGSGRRR